MDNVEDFPTDIIESSHCGCPIEEDRTTNVLVSGALGKKKQLYYCGKCGFNHEY